MTDPSDNKSSEVESEIQPNEPPMFIIDWESLGYLDIDWME